MLKSSVIIRYLRTIMGVACIVPNLICCSGAGIGIGGSSIPPNDVSPTGIPRAQGVFMGQNGKTLTGNASVFNVSGSSFILRLEGITTPSESGLQVQLFSQDGQTNFTLRANSGSQNYSFTSGTPSLSFNKVSIFSTSANLIYGSAILK